MSWLLTLGLRAKLIAGAVLGVLITMITMSYLYARWRIAAAKAASATARADALDATRQLELQVADKRAALTARQAELRKKLGQRTQRDYFDGGWGP